MENQAICLTFGEQSENHVGMRINGEGLASSGFSIEELEQIKRRLFALYFSINYNIGARTKEMLAIKWSDITVIEKNKNNMYNCKELNKLLNKTIE